MVTDSDALQYGIAGVALPVRNQTQTPERSI
jgi:hypothetical protein